MELLINANAVQDIALDISLAATEAGESYNGYTKVMLSILDNLYAANIALYEANK